MLTRAMPFAVCVSVRDRVRDGRPRDRDEQHAILATDLASSHHACTPNIRLMPLNTLSRPKSGFSFFDVGLKPDLARRPTTMPIDIIPMSIGATIADRLPRRVGRELHRAGLVRGARSPRPMSWSIAAHRASRRVRSSSGAARSSRASPTHAERSGDFATWPFSRAFLAAVLGLVSRSSARLSRGHVVSAPASADAERRDRVAHEVAERRARSAGARARHDDQRDDDAQREREREHVEVRRGARRADRA